MNEKLKFLHLIRAARWKMPYKSKEIQGNISPQEREQVFKFIAEAREAISSQEDLICQLENREGNPPVPFSDEHFKLIGKYRESNKNLNALIEHLKEVV